MHQTTLTLPPARRGLHDITHLVQEVVRTAKVEMGLCHVFLQHTSASLVIQENADPDVRRDMETWFAGAVQDGDPRFHHVLEGPDDMSAHLRAALTQPSLTLPVAAGKLALGTWQGLYLFEHRTEPHRRRVVITVQ
ncbi:MAG: YjbQ family protein [Deltaproteobacteria bacterium]|nr:YjbQ family protein [Deltaproteobacteria bacterium]